MSTTYAYRGHDTPLEVHQHNPKRGQSQIRYERYKAATTYGEYLALGGTAADLRHDVPRGFVRIIGKPQHSSAPAGDDWLPSLTAASPEGRAARKRKRPSRLDDEEDVLDPQESKKHRLVGKLVRSWCVRLLGGAVLLMQWCLKVGGRRAVVYCGDH